MWQMCCFFWGLMLQGKMDKGWKFSELVGPEKKEFDKCLAQYFFFAYPLVIFESNFIKILFNNGSVSFCPYQSLILHLNTNYLVVFGNFTLHTNTAGLLFVDVTGCVSFVSECFKPINRVLKVSCARLHNYFISSDFV